MLVAFFWVFGIYCMSTRIDISSSSPGAHSSVAAVFLNPSSRGFYWGIATDVIRHYPWFGCGYNAYVQTLKDMHISNQEYPHNSLLHITAELGFVGLVAYCWLFVALCLQIKNVLNTVFGERDLFLIGCGISCGIMAWLIHSLMDTPWSSLQLNILLWSFIGILLSLRRIKEGAKPCH
jgi:O-antigen ligase